MKRPDNTALAIVAVILGIVLLLIGSFLIKAPQTVEARSEGHNPCVWREPNAFITLGCTAEECIMCMHKGGKIECWYIQPSQCNAR